VGGFVSRWVVSQSHEVQAADLDAEGCIADETLSRWISDACELGDDIRDELIALEHAARHIN
jgi:hypothetical protein